MSWSGDDFFPAFADEGMLSEAVYTDHLGVITAGIMVGFTQPDVLMLGDMVQSTEYQIEFQTADMPALQIDETLQINSITYRVRRNPEKLGDGLFSKVLLGLP